MISKRGGQNTMKITDAVWEKRNLDVDAMEFEIAVADNKSIVADILANEKQYNVVKVPESKTEIMFELSANGYSFTECLISLRYNLRYFNEIRLLPMQKRMMNSISYAKMSESDLDEMFAEIRSGLFFTDRVALDPYFEPNANGNRYAGWIGDSLKINATAYKLVYKDKNIGFFVNREIEPGIYFPFLAGMYAKYQKPGFGLSAVYIPLKNCYELGGNAVSTGVSSNNLSVLKIHLMLGFTISHIQYVFVKHNS
jgi:hypothetical protein